MKKDKCEKRKLTFEQECQLIANGEDLPEEHKEIVEKTLDTVIKSINDAFAKN